MSRPVQDEEDAPPPNDNEHPRPTNDRDLRNSNHQQRDEYRPHTSSSSSHRPQNRPSPRHHPYDRDRGPSHHPNPNPNHTNNNNNNDSTPPQHSPLQIEPLERFRTTCVAYQQPKEIACFSYDEGRRLLMGSESELNWYYPPDLTTADLSSGFPSRYITRNPTVLERIDALLEVLLHLNTPADSADSLHQKPPIVPDFLTWRGILTKILTTPYSTDAYELGITLYNHTIFIEEHDLRPPTAAYGSSERDKLMTYMGYKFESLATVDTPPGVLQGMGEGEREGVLARRDGGVVNTNRQYCCVVKTRVGRHGVVMGAEVDCLVDDVKPKTNPQTAYAELKTNRVITNPNQRRSFERHKLLKVWAQSFLPGIPTVIVGYRHDDGRLSHIQSLKTMSIPRMVRESASQSGRGGGGGHGEPPWDPTICLNFGNAFLDWVRGVVGVGFGDADVVYTVRCDYDDGDDGARRGGGYGRGGGRRRVVKLVKIERGVQGPTGVFIPQWYREGRRPGSDA